MIAGIAEPCLLAVFPGLRPQPLDEPEHHLWHFLRELNESFAGLPDGIAAAHTPRYSSEVTVWRVNGCRALWQRVSARLIRLPLRHVHGEHAMPPPRRNGRPDSKGLQLGST